MIIKNVNLFTEKKEFVKGEIFIENGRFTDHSETGPEIDGKGCYAIPGLIDLHLHGCMGYDFCDGSREAIEKIAEYEASVGVTGIAPATMTLPVEELEQILSTAAAYKKDILNSQSKESSKGADLLGINMEGPFISKVKKGAQNPDYILPCSQEISQRFLDASHGLVKFIGIAPEDNLGFENFIRQMKEKVNISLAHTNADYTDAMAAFSAGANHAVHLYNAMPPFSHRAPGVIGAVADSPHVYAELICDGVHIHPSAVRGAFSMMGADRIVLISDSMRATGMPDGRYSLGGLDVDVKGNRATLTSDGALAGSATNLMDCMRTAVQEMGIPLETAVACATINPAKSLGVEKQYGSISPGKQADLVLLDKDLKLQQVIKSGTLI
ncbi:MAG: N-acetylglucosamine-6-phosphate deacetylase [Lachnospiraceae bacterium]|nr:N-acetylglucosamine-6-phosphate deacetylase [Lachnospiraceae bacterium]